MFNKQRCLNICFEIQDKLSAITQELQKDTPYNGYLLEKLQTLETDVPCLKQEFSLLQIQQTKE